MAWLLPVFAWAPLTYPGYFAFLNGFAPVFNLNDLIGHGLTAGWAPVIGQGYDLLRGEGILPYLVAALPRVLGLPGPTGIKFVFIAALLSGAVGTYGWTRRRLGAWPGLLAAAVYAFWPLGLATTYVRGALADAVMLGLLPLAWWAAEATAGGHNWRAGLGLALVLAAALWTQAGLALWLVVSLLAYLLVANAVDGGGWRGLAGWAAGLTLGVLGLVPRVLAQGGLGGPGYVNFSDHFVYPYQLLQAGWDLGPSISGPYDLLPLQLGLVACGLAAIGALFWPGRGRAATSFAPTGDGEASIVLTRRLAPAFILVPVALSLTLAAPLWSALPFLSRSLTYPWQLLLLAGPWLAWLSGLGGLVLVRLIPGSATPALTEAGVASIAGDGPHGSGGRLGEPRPANGSARSPVVPAATYAEAAVVLPLFAALIGLALLGVYADLNPPSTPVTVEQPVAIFGDNQVALLSAVVSPTVASKATLRVQWQALRPLDQDYTVFVHAEGPDGSIWGQQDTMPRNGKSLTSSWRPGALIDDQYTVDLKPGAPAGMHLTLGLYQWQTGQRLTTGRDNQIILLEGPR
ncbi:MAG TPA: hypothetical protein VGA61_16245 [Anaerolineae bacterium]